MPSAAPTSAAAPIACDALIIGAGPAGLYAAFQLGLLGLQAHIAEAQPHTGGQCSSLYPHKALFDVPALAALPAGQLAAQLQAQLGQLKHFEPAQQLHLGQRIAHIEKQANGRFFAHSAAGRMFDAQCLILAVGAGALQPKRPAVAGLADLPATALHHSAGQVQDFAGQAVCIMGDDDTALHWACDLAEARVCASLHLNHRRRQLSASTAAQTRMQALCEQGLLQFSPGLPQRWAAGQLQLLQADGTSAALPCTRLGLFLGHSPQLPDLAQWGLAVHGKLATVSSHNCASSAAGVFAIGDIAHYSGKLKLISAAFHEATLAAHAALAYCRPEAAAPLAYASCNAALQSRLHNPEFKL